MKVAKRLLGLTKPIQKENCTFCRILSSEKEKIIGESENTFAIHTRTNQGFKERLLIIPKVHLKSIKFLKKKDLPILLEMKELGHKVGKEIGKGNKYRLGFHIPPFFSIEHLHLHVCIEPCDSLWKSWVKFGLILRDIDEEIRVIRESAEDFEGGVGE